MAERTFLIQEERIQLRYHCRDDHITASKREFLRRTEVDSKGNKIIMTPDMCISFEVGLGRRGGSLWVARTLTHGSQLGTLSLPLGKLRSSHLGTLVTAAPLKIFPLSHQERQPNRPRLVLTDPSPQSWREPTPDPGANTGVGEGPTTSTEPASVVEILTLLAHSLV